MFGNGFGVAIVNVCDGEMERVFVMLRVPFCASGDQAPASLRRAMLLQCWPTEICAGDLRSAAHRNGARLEATGKRLFVIAVGSMPSNFKQTMRRLLFSACAIYMVGSASDDPRIGVINGSKYRWRD